MHPTAMAIGKHFFEAYVADLGSVTVVDVGSQDVNGTLRDVCPSEARYIGVDFAHAKGVDIVLTDPYRLPFETGTIDAVVSSSCFEHSEMFWLLCNEVMRILKPHGVFYVNAPSNGPFHRYPVDCWRFYPDAGKALVSWLRRSGYDACLLESFTARQDRDLWNDFVAVFLKNQNFVDNHKKRIVTEFNSFSNGIIFGKDGFLNFDSAPEDLSKISDIEAQKQILETELAAAQQKLKQYRSFYSVRIALEMRRFTNKLGSIFK